MDEDESIRGLSGNSRKTLGLPEKDLFYKKLDIQPVIVQQNRSKQTI